jgi:hypothetical protein
MRDGSVAGGALSLKRALRHVLLAVVLLVAQQAGYEHALSHFEQSSPSKEKQLPHTKACTKCGLSAQLGTGLLSNPGTFVSAAGSACVPLRRFQAFHPAAPRRFLSRAPPASL